MRLGMDGREGDQARKYKVAGNHTSQGLKEMKWERQKWKSFDPKLGEPVAQPGAEAQGEWVMRRRDGLCDGRNRRNPQ